jgi:hypothetical protein
MPLDLTKRAQPSHRGIGFARIGARRHCWNVLERLALTPTAAQPARAGAPSAAERVLAAELEGRSQANGALSMMVTSMVHMVQAGKSPRSRWQSS